MAKAKARKTKVDLSGVETFKRANEGSHLANLKEATMGVTGDGDDMIQAKFEIVNGKSKGAIVYDNFPLMDTALWKIKALLEAFGMKADGKIIIDLDKLENKRCMIEVEHEEYKGKTRAKISKYDRIEADDVDDDDIDEDEDEDEEEEEVKAKPSKKSKAATKGKKKPPVEEEDDDDDEDTDDDDEEEEEKPKKKPASKKKPAAKGKKKPPVDEDDDDEDDEDWEDE